MGDNGDERGSFLDLSIHPREDEKSAGESISEKNKPKGPVKGLINDLIDDAGDQNKNELIGEADGNRKEDNKALLTGLEKLPDEDKDDLIDNLIEVGDKQKKVSIDFINGIPEDDMSEPPDDLDRSMIAERPKKKDVSSKKDPKSKKGSKKPAKKRSGNNINDLRASEEDMAPIKDWDFEPERLPERHKAGSGSRNSINSIRSKSSRWTLIIRTTTCWKKTLTASRISITHFSCGKKSGRAPSARCWIITYPHPGSICR